MSEWLTYAPSDFLLFSQQTYYRLFELYNEDIWPMQLLALSLGAATAVLVLRKPAWQGRAITAILAACWIWVAWAFLLKRYATINWAAVGFAAVFLAEALLLIWTGVVRGRLVYRATGRAPGRVGFAVFAFALVAYPVIGALSGRKWLQAELFGTAPDPTVIATLGMLLMATGRSFWELLFIPIIWCAISALTLWTMGSPQYVIILLAVAVVGGFAVLNSWHGRLKS